MNEKVGVYKDPRNKLKSWVVRWFGEYDFAKGKQKRYTKSFRLKVEAEAFAVQKSNDFSQGYQRDGTKETLKQCCDEYFRLNKNLRPETLKLYSYTVERLLGYFGPDCLLRKITRKRAKLFMVELKPLKGDKLSDWTINRTLRHCKAILKKEDEQDRTIFQPFGGKKLSEEYSVPDASDFHYITVEEYDRLMDSTPTLRQKCLYALCYTGGCRFSEAVSRQWGDLNFDAGELRIASRKETEQHPPFVLKGKKGKRFPRKVPLPPQTLTLLSKLRMQSIDTPFIFFGGDNYRKLKAKWQSYQKQGRAWRWQDAYLNVNRDLCKHVAKAAITIKPDEQFSIHTLRKCAGKNWATVNRDPKITQGLMGHRNYATTMNYYDKVTPEDRTKAQQAIEAMLKTSKIS